MILTPRQVEELSGYKRPADYKSGAHWGKHWGFCPSLPKLLPPSGTIPCGFRGGVLEKTKRLVQIQAKNRFFGCADYRFCCRKVSPDDTFRDQLPISGPTN